MKFLYITLILYIILIHFGTSEFLKRKPDSLVCNDVALIRVVKEHIKDSSNDFILDLYKKYLNRCNISVKLIIQIIKTLGKNIKAKQEVLEKYLEKYNDFDDKSLKEMCDLVFEEGMFCENNGCHEYAVLSYSFILKKCKNNDLYTIRALLYIPRLTYNKVLYDETFNRIQRNAVYLKNEHKFAKNYSVLMESNPLFYYNYKYYPALPYVKNVNDVLKKYLKIDTFVSPFLDPSLKRFPHTPDRIRSRIGFIISFYHPGHVHAQYIRSLIRSLSLDYDIYLFVMDYVLNDPIFRYLKGLYKMPIEFNECVKILSRCELDILIFSDIYNSIGSYLLSMGRSAYYQIMHLINPITSGCDNIDYYISSDIIENHEKLLYHYTEQPILFRGLIHYQEKYKYIETNRKEYDINEDEFVLGIYQDITKYSPIFIETLKQITKLSNRISLLFLMPFTGFNREKYYFKCHMIKSFKGTKMHFINRVEGRNRFLGLMTLSDLMLHTFPYDGSQTAIDSINAGVLYVTNYGEDIRGRLGGSFYKIIDMEELIAKNEKEYIEITMKLINNETYYKEEKKKMLSNREILFNNADSLLEWNRFIGNLLN